MLGKSTPKEISISAVVKRDGKIENLGVISYYHKSWFRRFKFRIRRLIYGRCSKGC